MKKKTHKQPLPSEIKKQPLPAVIKIDPDDFINRSLLAQCFGRCPAFMRRDQNYDFPPRVRLREAIQSWWARELMIANELVRGENTDTDTGIDIDTVTDEDFKNANMFMKIGGEL